MLTPTYHHPAAGEYSRTGGPWDLPTLDVLLTAPLATGATAPAPLVADDTGTRLDGPRIAAAVAALAGGLRGLGVARGDAVAWQLANGHEAVLLSRACWRLGAVAAPIHHQAGSQDATRMLGVLRPAAVLARPGSVLLDSLGAVEVGSAAWDHLLAADPVEPADSPARPADLAAALFTSGSSGAPKAVLHSQRTLATKAVTMAGVHGLGPGDCVLMPAPLAHISGLLNGLTLPGVVPFRTVLMARWDPERALDLIEREQVTFMVGPPTFFVGLIDARGFASERVASLRLVSSGGAGVTAAFVARARDALGCAVKRTYGSTEAPTVATSTPDDEVDRAAGHDGRAVGAARLRVSDPASGVEVPPGRPGELWVQGPEVCCGYAEAAETAAAFTPDGWFRTGDLATVDRDGWLTIVGRLKDVIIRGGENIAAAEVEGVLEAHPAIVEAVAVGYPDERLGERVCAFVVARAGFDLEACRAWFSERGVARFKTPEQVVVVAALPLLATGKPDREALRADAARRFPP